MKLSYGLSAFLLLAALVFAFVLRQPTFPSDVTQFLPVDSASSQAAKQLAKSGLSRHIIILVRGKKRHLIVEDMVTELTKSGLFPVLRNGPPQNPASIHKLFFPHRYSFANASKQELVKLDTIEGMDKAAALFIKSLGGRYAGMMQRLGPEDPLLSYIGMLDRLSSLLRPELGVVDGKYESTSKEAVLFLEIDGSAFDATLAETIDHTIKESFKIAKTNADEENATMISSGVYRYTLKISASIKRDIQLISVVGLFGLLLVFGLVFGRLRSVLLPILSISIGGIFAFTITSLILGEVHLIAIAMGASLIGVCVDYAIHYLNHPIDSDHSVWPAIRIGALTTIGGFIVLFSSSVDALHQIALFSTMGVLGSVIATWVITQKFFRNAPTPRHTRAIHIANHTLNKIRNAPYIAVLLALPVFILILVGLPNFSLEEDLQSIRTPLPELKAADDFVREKVSGARSPNVVLIRGTNEDTALEYNDALARVLDRAVQDNLLEDYTSLHSVIWSKKTQQMNRDFFKTHEATLQIKMKSSFDKIGVESEMLAPLKKGFSVPDSYLTISDLRSSDLKGLADIFSPDKESNILFTYLGKVNNDTELSQRIEEVEGAFWFRQTQTLNDAWKTLSIEILKAIAFGLLLITLIAAISFRKKQAVFVALGPPVVGCIATLGLLSTLGISVGPIHGLALILVIAIAADYGVMLVAHHHQAGRLSLSIVMAYVSTMFSFGALSFSSHPILQAFGITIASGVTFALLLLPAFDWMLTRFKKTKEEDPAGKKTS